MFNTLIGSLTSFLPRNFIFGSFVPVLIFGFINLAMLYIHATGFRAFSAPQIAGPSAIFTTAVLFVAAVVFAYVLASIGSYLQEVLEGQHLWPGFLAARWRRSQQRRRRDLRDEYTTARDLQDDIANAEAVWQSKVLKALQAGQTNHAGRSAKTFAERRTRSALRRSLERLGDKRDEGRRITLAELQAAIDQTCGVLEQFDTKADVVLSELHMSLLLMLEDVQKNWYTVEIRKLTSLQTWFGNLMVEPTRMGNVGQALRTFTDNRYAFDLDTFWGRLQPLIRKNDQASYDALVDVKTQLDFLVACFWLSALTTAGWLVALGLFGNSSWAVLIIGATGPLCAYFFYSLSVQAYLSYAEVVRTAVELNRFALLRALHVPLPSGYRNERQLWSALREISQISSYASADVELGYRHGPP